MTFKELKFLIYSDLYRYSEKTGKRKLLSNLLYTPGFTYSFYMRLSGYLCQAKPAAVFKPLFFLSSRILLHYTYKFGISIPFNTQVGSGLYIGHFGGIVVNEHAVLGKNCNLSHDNTIGQANRGKNKGFPTIGDNVYIGPGAKIIGSVNIGDNVAIGANSVVTKDIPDSAVAVGIPAKVISYEGSKGYVNRTDY